MQPHGILIADSIRLVPLRLVLDGVQDKSKPSEASVLVKYFHIVLALQGTLNSRDIIAQSL